MNGSNSIPSFRDLKAALAALLLAAMLLAACQPVEAPAEAPAAAAAAALPTATSVPTATPVPPATATSTATPIPATTVAPTAPPTATPTEAGPVDAVINVADAAEFGPILVDGQGMTLYMFTKDAPDQSNCAGECLDKWPPLLTQGNPILGAGVDPAMVGFTTLADGRQIVTYNHMPLYYWYEDAQPGDTLGQEVGGVWYVVAPGGAPVGLPPTAQPTQKPEKENYTSGDY